MTEIDLHNWDVRKVTNFSYMFGANAGSSGYEGNGTFTKIDVSNWNVQSCTTMNSMFSG